MEERVRALVHELVVLISPVHDPEILVRLWVLESVSRAVREMGDLEVLRAREPAPAVGHGGHTWAEIGSALGVSSQAARQRAERRRQTLHRFDGGTKV
ncbi:hypothetical protein [Saccharothrix violaceirubra]|uniref:Uncharacterized protein n=1 Tax=Saccharothrix violaceirubra TaxID=413306 RepID=A0A7W7T483_9PSEU|nr:hypothetical protein [Saccharothrix violaceirubra]MBB4966041.1 hypothetical protein [Saccharothrix violaceirubra]